MTAAFTVVLPHKRNPRNTDALAICIDTLMRNTVNDFILSVDAAVDEPLNARINRMVVRAPTDTCVYWASDMFAARAWDIPMLEEYRPDRFITGIVVEPGVMAMHGQNYHRDFGRKPETFRRAAFEAWAQSNEAPMLAGEGWVVPVMFSAREWLAMGGLDTSLTSPDGFTGADAALFDRWKAAGKTVVRARSYCYHLQRFSLESEQEHPKRG